MFRDRDNLSPSPPSQGRKNLPSTCRRPVNKLHREKCCCIRKRHLQTVERRRIALNGGRGGTIINFDNEFKEEKKTRTDATLSRCVRGQWIETTTTDPRYNYCPKVHKPVTVGAYYNGKRDVVILFFFSICRRTPYQLSRAAPPKKKKNVCCAY